MSLISDMNQAFSFVNIIGTAALSCKDCGGKLNPIRFRLKARPAKTQFMRALMLETDHSRMIDIMCKSDLVRSDPNFFDDCHTSFSPLSEAPNYRGCSEMFCSSDIDPFLKNSPHKKPRSNSFATANPPHLSKLLSTERPSSLPVRAKSDLMSSEHDGVTLDDCEAGPSSEWRTGDSGYLSMDGQQPLDLSIGVRNTHSQNHYNQSGISNNPEKMRSGVESITSVPNSASSTIASQKSSIPENLSFTCYAMNKYSKSGDHPLQSPLVLLLMKMVYFFQQDDDSPVARCFKNITKTERDLLFNHAWPYMLPLYMAETSGNVTEALKPYLVELTLNPNVSKCISIIATLVHFVHSVNLSPDSCNLLRLAVAYTSGVASSESPLNLKHRILSMLPFLAGCDELLHSLVDLIRTDREVLLQAYSRENLLLANKFITAYIQCSGSDA